MSELSCEKPYVINKWLKNAGKTYPKLCVWNLSYKRFKCIQNSMLISSVFLFVLEKALC